MSGIDDTGAPPEVPEEYAATYRDAYLRALEEDSPGGPAPVEPSAHVPGGTGPLVPLGPALSGGGHSRRPVRLLLGAVVVLLVVGVAVLVALVSGGDGPAASPARSGIVEPGGAPATNPVTDPATSSAGPTPSGAPQGTPSEVGDAWQGSVLPVTPQDVTASCTAAPGVDSAGTTVRYDATNTLDGDPATAWRCEGTAIGETLTLVLPEGTAVAEVGLIPGYAKTDPDSGANRYAENNRITRVRWTLADGVTVEQHLDPSSSNRAVQTIRVPRTVTGSITLQVLAVKRGPRDTTAISEIEVGAAG